MLNEKSPLQTSSRLTFTVFAGETRLAGGNPADVARAIKAVLQGGERRILRVFRDHDAMPATFDATLDVDAISNALLETRGGSGRRGQGRPRLGVFAREVTLLPRHWAWLSAQPGGASVTLRKLVDAASHAPFADREERPEAAGLDRFVTAMASMLPWNKEALRAFMLGEEERFVAISENWPADLRDYARQLAGVTVAPPARAYQP